jgi:hypothetical protein
VAFVRQANLGVPFLFCKGNHDITGPGAAEAFRGVFHPFLAAQAASLRQIGPFSGACFAIEHNDALFCFFDAYDKESLPWLESALSRRSRHRPRRSVVVFMMPRLGMSRGSITPIFRAMRS